ncbi:MAG: radical SAM protein [Candidatus Scalindua sediminis]|nr:radical SAM protein [Candidatus Scalindua sediminis]
MRVNEIFKSIQGESTYAGIPCVFVRLTGCNLRCSYCDTTYAYEEGIDMSVNEIVKEIEGYDCKNVCITGGEPLLQKNVYKLINLLKTKSYKIFVETNGALNINLLPGNIIRIMDVKCPDSGMNKEMDWRNLERLRGDDEVKFVLSSKKDYEWAKRIVRKHNLPDKTNVLFGSAYGKLKPKSLAGWILKDRLNVRLQLQLQRIIWPDKTRGV